MSYFKRQYTRIQDYLLERKINRSPIQRTPGDYDSAQKIGLLFDATELPQRQIVLDYAESLRQQNKKVKLLGFYREKNSETNFTFKHFTLKDLNFWRQPKGALVSQFMEEPFDVLINLSLEAEPALEYISALSSAQLRVGPYTERTYCYDLMIATENRKDLSRFIEQVTFLLKKMNSKPYENTSA